MPTVYIPQEPLKRDPVTKQLVAVHDLTPALRFGKLAVLLRFGPVMLDTSNSISQLQQGLKTFCDADHILCTGDPAAIAGAIMCAAHINHGRVKVLRWDKREGLYLSLQYDTNES